MICYVVMGTTGEYSSKTEWLAMAYLSEEKAKKHVTQASDWFRANVESGQIDILNEDKFKNPYDPDMQVDYTGTAWYYEECELNDEI